MNRNEFVEKLKLQLDDINKEVDELEARVIDVGAEAKEGYQGKASRSQSSAGSKPRVNCRSCVMPAKMPGKT